MELPEDQSLFSAASEMQTEESYLPTLAETSGVLCIMFAQENQNAVDQGKAKSRQSQVKVRKGKERQGKANKRS